MQTTRIGFVSLGCPKATVDSEQILTRLCSEGYEIVNEYNLANVIIINTCGFINEAIDESLSAIEEALCENGQVIVTGCLGAKPEIIQERFDNILAISGPAQLEQVIEAVHKFAPPLHLPKPGLVPDSGIKLTPRHYAYLKISEGCSHRCSFCIIPQLRGDLVSRPMEDILVEAETLIHDGVKELLIVSQDTTSYGADLNNPVIKFRDKQIITNLIDLSEQLSQLDAWVRLHYLYPFPLINQILPFMKNANLLPYLDVPFQHASPTILRQMKRPGTQEKLLDQVLQWRDIVPKLTIRSTFIVGFPGETEQDFLQLVNFIEKAQLDRVGTFKYSPVDGAPANQLPDQIPEAEKEDRLQELMAVQAQISHNRLREKVGETVEVIIDQTDDEQAIGRTQGDSPDIDGIVHIELNDGYLQPGDFARITITDSDEHDLWGELA